MREKVVAGVFDRHCLFQVGSDFLLDGFIFANEGLKDDIPRRSVGVSLAACLCGRASARQVETRNH